MWGLLDGTQVGSLVNESQIQCHIDKHSPRNMTSKREAEPSNYDSFSECKSSYLRRSTRQQHMATGTQKRGKLDSRKFEVYLENMWRCYTEEKKNSFTYLDSLWFSLYSKGACKEKVLSWIKKKNIFSKKYVFVPIVQWGHWFLLILCNFGENPEAKTKSRCMLLLDSLKEAHAKKLEPGIRRFVFDIFNAEERPENKNAVNKIPLRIPKVPQQKSDTECGFYVLYYINLCVQSALESCSFSMGCPRVMKEDWFGPEEVECFVRKLESM
ncbi:sentrin/sumo-specific protease [Striga asiatica]|uniref:Sentrin/sumo-specific protease n=1 Tax=Striga asiatica TaxID=4170 RepID=A0A5A7Q4D5_STRAF|nr:sentrin/sumo-specific protease [Striga asiatica]